MKRIKFLNTFIDRISLDELIVELNIRIDNREKTHIVYLNSLKLFELDRSKNLKKAIENADYILADGVPLVWASKLLGQNLPGRVNGTDVFERLLQESSKRKKRVFFLGATNEVLENMIKNVTKKYPNLIIAGFRNGYFSDAEDLEIIKNINESSADILFLGFSSPKKELWVFKYKNEINIPIIKGVGGSFDILAGKIKRSPIWMQKSGLEWFYRLLKEPRRMFKRYLICNTYFVFLVIKSLIQKNKK